MPTEASVNQNVTTAQNNGAALQSQYNQQAAQQYGNYQSAYGNAQGAQSALSNFSSNLPNYGNVYGQDLTNAQASTGYNPQSLINANQVVAQQNALMAHIPQAVQQQGNYYGTTAGQTAGNEANMQGNVAANQAYANTQQQNQLNLLAATQQQANQQATLQLGGQNSQLQAYQQAAANATNIMQQAGSVMATIEGLAQTQGTATANQIAAYQNAYSQYISAQAAQTQAQAAIQIAPSTVSQQSSQATLNQQQAVANYKSGNPKATAQDAATALGLPLATVSAYWATPAPTTTSKTTSTAKAGTTTGATKVSDLVNEGTPAL